MTNTLEETGSAPDQYQQLQPEYYRHFQCLADACPDTCCEGWRVGIDKNTYSKYQESGDPVLKPAFEQFVTINPARTSDDQYATFSTSGGRCSFLSDGLCSIQKRLGETYLGAACASFPRVTNLIQNVLERSLDLSCPEAARLALLHPAPLEFLPLDTDPTEHNEGVAVPSHGRILSTPFSDASSQTSNIGVDQVTQIRKFVLSLLRNRKYPVSKRLILLAHVCDKLHEIAAAENYDATPAVLAGFSHAIEGGLFDEHLKSCTAEPAAQLGIVLDLVAERLKSDFTHRRFLELYQEFLAGLRWTPETTLQEMGNNYAEVHRQSYTPLLSQHEYVLENYLVNNAFKTLFPFGSQSLNRALNLDMPKAITAQYLLLTSYYAIAKGMLIGVAGHQALAFNLDTVVKTVQICSKTFEHSISFPKRILEILAGNGITNSAGMTVLTQN